MPDSLMCALSVPIMFLHACASSFYNPPPSSSLLLLSSFSPLHFLPPWAPPAPLIFIPPYSRFTLHGRAGGKGVELNVAHGLTRNMSGNKTRHVEAK